MSTASSLHMRSTDQPRAARSSSRAGSRSVPGASNSESKERFTKRLTPELSRPTAREPGVELMPQQRLCLQMGRSGFGLNDLLGAARLPTEGDGDEQYKGSTQNKSGECVRQ